MTKKKKKFWETPTGIIAIIAMFGALSTAIVKTAVYIGLPDRVEASEGQIIDLKSIIQQQQAINDYYYQQEQQVQQQPQPYLPPPEYREPPRRCYDWWEGYEYEIDCITGDWL